MRHLLQHIVLQTQEKEERIYAMLQFQDCMYCKDPDGLQIIGYFNTTQKKQSDKEHEDKNVLYNDGDKLFLSIDVFKTRWRVAGGTNVRKELMPRYVKEVNPRLASILKDYIKKWNVKDMSKLTPAEKRAKAQFYIFYKETGTPSNVYDEGSFSKVVSNCFKAVFNKRVGLTANTFRHIFNTWIAFHLNEFTDAQLQEISIDVGDTAKNLPTHLRYRIAEQGNKDMEKTEIEGAIHNYDNWRNQIMEGVQEEGSTGNAVNPDVAVDVDEVQSPAPLAPIGGDATKHSVLQTMQKYYEAKLKLVEKQLALLGV
jgi:hypothetical protein